MKRLYGRERKFFLFPPLLFATISRYLFGRVLTSDGITGDGYPKKVKN